MIHPDDYFALERADLMRFLVQHVRPSGRALDVGCAQGGFGASLLQAGYSEVWGVEPNTVSAQIAATRLTKVLRGTFPDTSPAEGRPFALVAFADSLEHMCDPWSALAAARGLVGSSGRLLVSAPNVAHYSVIGRLLRGQWRYEDSGLLDCDHMRFFTPDSLREAVVAAGWRVVAEGRFVLPTGRRWWLLERLAAAFASHVLAFQVYLLAEPV